MDNIRFERRKKKKGYLIPLIVILLLFIIIPVYLINKGSSLIEQANNEMKNDSVYGPTVEFYNGVSFLKTASAIPGFGGWANNIEEEAIDGMIKKQKNQFKQLIVAFFGNNTAITDSTELVFSKENNQTFIKLKGAQNDSIQSLELNDSLLNIIDESYCSLWIKFFDKTKVDRSQLYEICQ